MQIDASSEFGRRVAKRLAEDQIVWLTSVGADGTPQPNPVWFLWDGATLLIYSRPEAARLRHIVRDPRVSLNLNSDADGDDIVVITGMAAVAPDEPSASESAAFIEKYRTGIANLGMNPESFAAAYSVALRVTPEKLRGF